MNIKRRALMLAVAGAAVAAAPMTATAAEPGQVCRVDNYGGSRPFVLDDSRRNLLYSVNPGDTFRIVAYAEGLYRGHAYGRADGYIMRQYIVQASCRF
jgi:hypothetical protein